MSWRLIRWPNGDKILREAERIQQSYRQQGVKISLRKCIEKAIKGNEKGGFTL